MKAKGRRVLFWGSIMIVLFVVWTILIQKVDVRPIGQNGAEIGFATFNAWFHGLTGVHMTLYIITDWLGLIPIFVCVMFGWLGLLQLIKRRSFFKVDYDIIALGLYYILVIIFYLIFEMIPINYRPIPINGIMEASYPSSTTLLVLCVMPTLAEQVKRRIKSVMLKTAICIFVRCFSMFMVIGRLISGVHWVTDIVGAVLLSVGLFCMYQGIVMFRKL